MTDKPMTMIEIVKNGLAAKIGEPSGCGDYGCSCYGAENIIRCLLHVSLEALARAAIEAMREPTEAMMEAAGTGLAGGADRWKHHWRCAIDAALSEKP